MNVLIVEDSRARAAFFRDVLAGHDLYVERSGTSGIAALREQIYDLVLLDHDLTSPRVTGYDVARAMAETKNAQTAVVIQSTNIEAARRIPPLLPRCRMLSMIEMRAMDEDRLRSTLEMFAEYN